MYDRRSDVLRYYIRLRNKKWWDDEKIYKVVFCTNFNDFDSPI